MNPTPAAPPEQSNTITVVIDRSSTQTKNTSPSISPTTSKTKIIKSSPIITKETKVSLSLIIPNEEERNPHQGDAVAEEEGEIDNRLGDAENRVTDIDCKLETGEDIDTTDSSYVSNYAEKKKNKRSNSLVDTLMQFAPASSPKGGMGDDPPLGIKSTLTSSPKQPKQPKPSQVVPSSIVDSPKIDESRSIGANSAVFTDSINSTSKKSILAGRRSILRRKSSRLPTFSLEKYLENQKFDAKTRSSLITKFNGKQTYVDIDTKDLNLAQNYFHLLDTKQLKVKKLKLDVVSPELVANSISHGGGDEDILVTSSLEVPSDMLSVVAFYWK